MGLGAVAGATLAGSALSAGAGLIGASKAAGASKNAAALQMQQYQTTRGDLMPFIQGGAEAMPQVNALLQGGNFEDTLRRTPGYQFTLDQGLKATQAAAAARGLGVSGAALKGAATYATGLADNTYQKLFQDSLETAKLGANAAAGLGQQGTQAAAQAGAGLVGAGTAQASGIQGIGNALNQGVSNYLGYQAYQNAMKGGPTLGYDEGGLPKTGVNAPGDTGWY